MITDNQPKCLAIVQHPISDRSTATRSGNRVFLSFQDENRTSFWNSSLVEAIDAIDYVGFMRPGTVLVSGTDAHLDVLRSAWSRRVLKPSRGFHIKRLGDIGGIEMHDIAQTQFVPLTDVLCLTISLLNRTGQPATIETICRQIARDYANMPLPRIELVTAALITLGHEGKVYCMGEHYFVSTPNMIEHYRRTTCGTVAAPSNDRRADTAPYHTANVQLKQESCTQTGASIIGGTGKSCRDQAALANEIDSMAAFGRIIKPTTDTVQHRNSIKDKDARKGFFARLFRRSRERLPNKENAEPQSIDTLTSDANTNEHHHLIFGAQFPPPEWMCDPRLVQQPSIKTRNTTSKEQRDRYLFKPVIEPSTGAISSAQRYCTFPDNLNDEQQQYQSNRRRHHRYRLSKYLSSSSECLNYGPIDPPHCLPPNAEAELCDDFYRRREKRRRKYRKSERLDILPSSGRADSTLRLLETVDSADDPTLNVVTLDHHHARTSTPVDRRITTIEPTPPTVVTDSAPPTIKHTPPPPIGSDSAYSHSPVITTDSSNTSSSRADKYSSWSGSEGVKQQPSAPDDQPSTSFDDHTYMNLDHHRRVDTDRVRTFESMESTRFEDVDSVVQQLHSTELGADESVNVRIVKSVQITNV